MLARIKKYFVPLVLLNIGIYGVLWNFAESMGVWPRPLVFFVGIAASSILSIVYTTAVYLTGQHVQIRHLRDEIAQMAAERDALTGNASHCCVIKQSVPVCPLGVANIYSHTEDSIRSSLEGANKRVSWFGLSAFNVVHKNDDIFARKKDVAFDFAILSPKNHRLQAEVDKYFGETRGKMTAGDLISSSIQLLDKIRGNVHSPLTYTFHNQMPTFRIIAVDDRQTFVSFYDRGEDALRTFQVELKEGDGISFPMKKWFDQFLEKSKITEACMEAGHD